MAPCKPTVTRGVAWPSDWKAEKVALQRALTEKQQDD